MKKQKSEFERLFYDALKAEAEPDEALADLVLTRIAMGDTGQAPAKKGVSLWWAPCALSILLSLAAMVGAAFLPSSLFAMICITGIMTIVSAVLLTIVGVKHCGLKERACLYGE